MRVLGIDVGRRRVGLAISDPSGTLARPLTTLAVASGGDAVARVMMEVTRLSAEEAASEGARSHRGDMTRSFVVGQQGD